MQPLSPNVASTPQSIPTGPVSPPAVDRSQPPVAYPAPKLNGPLAQRGSVGIQGLGATYLSVLHNDKRFMAEVLNTMRNNNIPDSDAQAGVIVSGLLFLSRIDPSQMQGEVRHELQQVTRYAKAKLDDFLSASKANAISGGRHPSDPVLANVRNEALAVVNKYLATDGVVVPNVKPGPFIPKGTQTI
jgi:hypothetical protein